ncbi:MAG: SH3 domain-containing protein [Anaerolineales bacterium]|nr:SH3 domain-containing protein [Anaerolineales bacterium]
MNKMVSSLRGVMRSIPTKQSISILLLIFIIGCTPQQVTVDGGQETATPTVHSPPFTVTNTPQPTVTIAPTSTQTSTPQLVVTITAARGNLYIRRGPEMAYSRIGVLKKGESAEVIAQDVLSRWVQIKIPNSDLTGWVSMMTDFSEINGDLKTIPNFTFTDYPKPAYIKNCTEHELHIEPGNLYLYNLYTNAKYLNEVQVDSGVYYIYDATLLDVPLIQTVDVQEGEIVYVTVNGLGEKHKCP